MTSTETRDRFLVAIADRVGAEAVAELHLFPPIRQGGLESGVAVVAVEFASHNTGDDAEAESGKRKAESGERKTENGERKTESRLTVYTATYRLTLKGPERGKWEFAMTAEADAPLVTIDAVVRGVQRRSGDAEDPEKLSGDEFRALVPAGEPIPRPTAG